MEKRVILAFVLSFAILYGFRLLYAPGPTGPTPTEPVKSVSSVEKTPEAPAPVGNRPTGTSTDLPATSGNIQAERSEDVTVDTPFYSATISNVGSSLKSFKLKAYADAEGHPIELIDEKSGEKLGWPLAISTGDAGLDDMLAKARFAVQRQDNRISMEYAENGLHVRRVFEFDLRNYDFSLDTKISKDGKPVPYSLLWQGRFGDQSIPPDPAKRNTLYQQDTAFKRLGLRSLKEKQEINAVRVGVEDQYFLAMFLSAEGAGPVSVDKRSYPGPDGKPVDTFLLSARVPEPEPVRVYVGPKDRTWLTTVDPQLDAVIDYGWFQIIARPLVFFLLLIHSYVGNFGWAIIFLTIAINFLLFPLRLKQQISMQKMQKIQPQMRTLQDRYKKLKVNDPRRAQVQAEMMGLYKQHGVNPMGGCLPLVLQMPVLFGFYSMLSVSIELRRAPWILWIKDLSQHDPYYIIPVLMAVSMFVMQRMTPTTVDPAQAKMMMIMPLMLTVMFLWVQSGLMLYWLTSNMVGIGQQVFINKYWSPRSEAKLQAQSKPKEAADN